MGSHWVHFGVTLNNFGVSLKNFGVTFGSRWRPFGITSGHFGVTLVILWGHFGVMLASRWVHFGFDLGSLNLVLEEAAKKMGTLSFLAHSQTVSVLSRLFLIVWYGLLCDILTRGVAAR